MEKGEILVGFGKLGAEANEYAMGFASKGSQGSEHLLELGRVLPIEQGAAWNFKVAAALGGLGDGEAPGVRLGLEDDGAVADEAVHFAPVWRLEEVSLGETSEDFSPSGLVLVGVEDWFHASCSLAVLRVRGPAKRHVASSSCFWRPSASLPSSQILVTTAVIDNGINLCDVSLKHIVLLTIDHVQFIQQLGRKRMNDGETLHVWVPDLTQNQTEKLQHRNARLLQALDHFACMTIKEKYGLRYRLWYENDAELRHLFVMDADEPLSVNACAEKVVQQRRIFYQELSAAFESGEKHPFIHHVLRWLNLPEAAIGDCEWHNTIDHEEFLEFLANYTAIPMRTKEEQEKFSMEFRRYRTAIFGPRKKGNRRSDPWGKEIISRELEELKLPFKLNIEDDAWMIRSTNQPD